MSEPPDLAKLVALDDFEALAEERMEPGAFAYFAGGAWDEVTLQNNVAAFRKRRLLPRVLVDVSHVDTSTTMLTERVEFPFGLAPAALQRLAHPDGELASARAAAAAGVIFCVSTWSNVPLEEVARTADGPRWFQLYVHRDRSLTAQLIKRAAEAGYRALVVTVDLPVPGYREREFRSGFKLPLEGFGNLDLSGDDSEMHSIIGAAHDASLTWDDLEWIDAQSEMPLVIKGILSPKDAARAVEQGARALIVSNHGGRQLDRAPAAVDVLEEILDSVQDGAEIYLDGGVRRGVDVCTALALGAKGVFVGRPYLYALAAAGEPGVARAIELLGTELRTAMTLLGAPSIADIRRHHVV